MNKSKRKINFIIYHFLVESKPYERKDLLIYQTKKGNKSIPIVMKTCFSEAKLMKQFGNPPFLREPPLSANPPISEQIFDDPLFVQILKTRTPPPLF